MGGEEGKMGRKEEIVDGGDTVSSEKRDAYVQHTNISAHLSTATFKFAAEQIGDSLLQVSLTTNLLCASLC